MREYFLKGVSTLVASIVLYMPTHAQNPIQERGSPYFVNYNKEEHGGRYDNWAVLQGLDGLMYFGNGNGVLEFDGDSWRLIRLPNRGIARSLGVDSKGRIYVGGFAELGYLEPDAAGTLTFVSLRDQLNQEDQDFTNVNQTLVVNDRVFFIAKSWIFEWLGDGFKSWKPPVSSFLRVYNIGGTLYPQDSEGGMYELTNEGLIATSAFETLPKNAIRGISETEDDLIVATKDLGLFRKKEASWEPLLTSADVYLKQNQVTEMIRLTNGWLAIGTRKGGLVVIDQKGGVMSIFNKEIGLHNNFIFGLGEDDQSSIWLGLANGITRVEIPSAFTVFDKNRGVQTPINDLIRYDGSIYAAGQIGSLKLSPGTEARFELVEGLGSSFAFLPLEEQLLIATLRGVVSLKDDRIKSLSDYGSSILRRSKKDPNLIYVGLFDGLAILRYENGQWIDGGRINNIYDDIREIVETKEGNLWMESQYDGVWFVDFSTGKDIHHPETRHFKVDSDLPRGLLFLHSIREEAVFEINGLVYKYNAELDSIMGDPKFGERFGLYGEIAPKLEDKTGNLWMYSQTNPEVKKRHRTVSKLQEDGSYELILIDDYRLKGTLNKVLYPEGDIAWYAGADGIIRHELNFEKPDITPLKAMVRRITVGKDSVIFGGDLSGYTQPVLDYSLNSMRFEFSSPSFTRSEDNLFQFRLREFDKEWSDWTIETKKDYTNIPEGGYAFEVRSKNYSGDISPIASFELAIDPPWFRTLWAYLSYFLLGVLGLYGIVNWRSAQLKRDKKKLEALIDEKTSEIKVQAEQLKELDKVKSQFFANISHEFRTPLTLILGPLENKLKGNNEVEIDDVKVMHRNANRLKQLIDQLLDLSKIESGNLQLQVTQSDVTHFLKLLLSSFSSHSADRKITYDFELPADSHQGYFDADKFEKIIYNLLSNAFKFTSDGGYVRVKVQIVNQSLELKVEDTGQGISEEELPHVFDRFYRTAESQTNEQEGTGIGLALTKELVELHHGKISVQSTGGSGTSFAVMLPLNKEQYTDDEFGQSSNVERGLENFTAPLNESTEALRDDDKPILLVVEDNEDLREYISKTFRASYNVLEADNGEVGLAIARDHIPDLIISDLMMPKMDGLELCGHLKSDEKTSHIPLILLTAKANIESKLEGLSTGADDYLTKPFNSEELSIRVKNLIAQRVLLRDKFSKEIILKRKDITVTSVDEIFIEKAMSIVEKHMSDEDFSVEDFQVEIGMSRMQLHRKLKALTGFSATGFVRVQRLKRAAILLIENGGNVSEVCYKVGISSLSYFTKSFKEQFGVNPSQYAESLLPTEKLVP